MGTSIIVQGSVEHLGICSKWETGDPLAALMTLSLKAPVLN